MELQGHLEELKRRGFGLAAITYDPIETLAAFSAQRGITFPILSDKGSEIIKRYGIFNESSKPGTRAYGIPHPGIFVLNARAEVVARYFEEEYQDRFTLSNVLLRLDGIDAPRRLPNPEGRSIHASQLEVQLSTSDAAVAPGNRFSLLLRITPGKRIHVYAPGAEGYIPVSVKLDSGPLLKVHEPRFPPSEQYYFAPLKERVQVYQKPFTIAQDVTINASREAQDALKGMSEIRITGTLDYQACDDRLCFRPESIPLAWTMKLKPLDRDPVQK
ncbi:MAG: redoxin domain-containing protein [Acidobacteria bacterium]|nr:redoxin domain-containing protein [Acidobacteriota bacterium]